MAEFDRDFWEAHWRERRGAQQQPAGGDAPNPYLVEELGDLAPGSALDAGCGAGAEAIWLADRGWKVTAADISAEALARAAEHAAVHGVADRVRLVEADLTSWDPGQRFDLVTTNYAHPVIPQPEFYDRIAEWVAPGGDLLIVGHLHTGGLPGHQGGHGPSSGASVTAAAVSARLDPAAWVIVTADERARTLTGPGGQAITLHDVVVRATRRA